ncbi:MAG: hypothetical protein K8S23_03765 [Candidatus Cloacimonetes bacterium]|nr:hypothetical protein [Candidatus Cloacimonadota bacterium]
MKTKNKMFWLLQIIILTIICIVGCDGNDNQPNMEYIYPLAIGNSWQYEKTYKLNFDSLATKYGLSDTTYYSSGLVEIVNYEVIFDTLEVFNLKSTINEEGNISVGYEYYNNIDNALFDYGYTSPKMITPKTEQKYSYIMFRNKRFNNVREVLNWVKKRCSNNEFSREDSINYDPVKSLEYPLKKGKQWIFRTEPWGMDKKVLGWEKVDVAAGKFDCWKIQFLYTDEDWNIEIIFYDYISEKGFVKRIVKINGLNCYDENGEFLGYVDTIEETILIDYEIK